MPKGGQPNAQAIKNLKNLHGELDDIIELGVKSTGNMVKPGPGDITIFLYFFFIISLVFILSFLITSTSVFNDDK